MTHVKFLAISNDDEYEFEYAFFGESDTRTYWDTELDDKTRSKAVRRATFYIAKANTNKM